MQEKVLSVAGNLKIKCGDETVATLRKNILSITGVTKLYKGKAKFSLTGKTDAPLMYECSGVEFWFGTKIKDGAGRVVAYVREKILHASALIGLDTYSLVVEPGHDCALILAMLVCMDKLRRKNNTGLATAAFYA